MFSILTHEISMNGHFRQLFHPMQRHGLVDYSVYQRMVILFPDFEIEVEIYRFYSLRPHQKLTEKLGVRERTWCHHFGGMYNISPVKNQNELPLK